MSQDGRYNLTTLDLITCRPSGVEFVVLDDGTPKRYTFWASYRGAWATATRYEAGNIVSHSGDIFIYTEDIPAENTTEPDADTRAIQLSGGGAAPAADTITTVYQRGVTTKDDGTTLLDINEGGDSFTLPDDWQTKKRLTMQNLTETTVNSEILRIVQIVSYDIPDMVAMGMVNANHTFTGNYTMDFNPSTGVFAATTNNANIDRILLVG